MKIYVYWFIIFIPIFCFSQISELQNFDNETLIKETKYLAKFIEDTHPDPYSAIGGRVSFFQEVNRVINDIPEQGMSGFEYYKLISQLFGSLKDGHSYINMPRRSSSKKQRLYLPIKLNIASDVLYVSNVLTKYEHLLGARISAIGGKSISELKKLAMQVFPAENDYGALRSLIIIISSNRYFDVLFPSQNKSLKFTFQNVDGIFFNEVISYSSKRDEIDSDLWMAPQWNDLNTDNAPFFYRWLDSENIAYLKIKEMVSRESFEIMQKSGRKDMREQIDRYYQKSLNTLPPDEIQKAIAGIPSLSETVYTLLNEMSTKQTKHLILDIRDNSGGWSSILLPIYYMLYGDKFFGYQFPITFATKISNAYLDLYGNTLDGFNEKKKSSYELGDYLVSKDEQILSAEKERIKYITRVKNNNYSFLSLIEKLNGRSIYTPKIIVIVNAKTYSAAYHFMYHLWHLGAVIVGVSSAQAGNSFVDMTPFKLPNTGLSGSVSRTAQIFFPDDKEKGKIFIPDFPMQWKDYLNYNFDVNSEIKYAKDLVINKRFEK